MRSKIALAFAGLIVATFGMASTVKLSADSDAKARPTAEVISYRGSGRLSAY
jgi:hypothetical protein